MIDPRSRMDEAIDRAVRDMVQRDARPGFGRRVRARLHRPSGRAAWVPRLVLATAAIAAIVIVTTVMRRGPAAPPPAARPIVAIEPAQPAPMRAAATADAAPSAPQHGSAPAAGAIDRGVRAGSRTVPRAERQAAAFGPPRDRVSAASLVEEAGELTPSSPPDEGTEATGDEIPPLTGPAPLVVPPILTPPLQLDSVTVSPVPVTPIAPRRDPR